MKFINRAPNSTRRRQSPAPTAAAPVSHRSTPWHAVSIVTRPECCRAAEELRTQRFLSAEAPRLPLAGCTMGQFCTCSYKHHADRRGPPRRKDELTGMRQLRRADQERRVSLTRRQTD